MDDSIMISFAFAYMLICRKFFNEIGYTSSHIILRSLFANYVLYSYR